MNDDTGAQLAAVADPVNPWAGYTDRELAERIASSLEAQGRQIDWMVNTAAPLLAAASELMADPSAAMRLFTGRK